MAEIEKKYQLHSLPPPELLRRAVSIEQGYIVADDGELRIRKKGDAFYLTVKGAGGLEREEWEIEIPAWVFATLWPLTKGRRVEKTRYSVPHQALMLQIDEFGGHLAGLVTLECEFKDKESAKNFALPSWASDAVDVTEVDAYKNRELAIRGRPS